MERVVPARATLQPAARAAAVMQLPRHKDCACAAAPGAPNDPDNAQREVTARRLQPAARAAAVMQLPGPEDCGCAPAPGAPNDPDNARREVMRPVLHLVNSQCTGNPRMALKDVAAVLRAEAAAGATPAERRSLASDAMLRAAAGIEDRV